jgi:hypothetical protein
VTQGGRELPLRLPGSRRQYRFRKERPKQGIVSLDCPNFVIVDEAHGSAAADPKNSNQQQRHQLVSELAADADRHMLLLTATPHSGIDAAFRSLLSLVRPEFGDWDITSLKEPQRAELARHLAQRTRKDIETDWEHERCFPKRDATDETYRLSAGYRDLFNRHDFGRNRCSRLVPRMRAVPQ